MVSARGTLIKSHQESIRCFFFVIWSVVLYGINACLDDTAYTQKLVITDIPTSTSGLPVGAIYRSGTDLKIVT